MKLKACADNVLKVRSKPQVHTLPPSTFGGPQIVPPVQLASDVQTAPALPAAQLVTFANRVLLICWKRWSYTTQPVSAGLDPLVTMAEVACTIPPPTLTPSSEPNSAGPRGRTAVNLVSVSKPAPS